MAVTPLKVIQSHHFRYQSKAPYNFTSYANSSNFHPVSHRFQDKADYWSNVWCQHWMPLSNAPVRNESHSGLRNLEKRCEKYLHVLNRLGMIYQCDRQKNSPVAKCDRNSGVSKGDRRYDCPSDILKIFLSFCPGE